MSPRPDFIGIQSNWGLGVGIRRFYKHVAPLGLCWFIVSGERHAERAYYYHLCWVSGFAFNPTYDAVMCRWTEGRDSEVAIRRSLLRCGFCRREF